MAPRVRKLTTTLPLGLVGAVESTATAVVLMLMIIAPTVRASFRDVSRTTCSTNKVFREIGHACAPYYHLYKPALCDINKDGFPDYISGNHHATAPNGKIAYDIAVLDPQQTRQAGAPVYSNVKVNYKYTNTDRTAEFDTHVNKCADLDGDGHADIFMATDQITPGSNNVILWGDKGSTFTGGRQEAINSGLAGKDMKSRGIIFADFDGDGDQDAYLLGVANKERNGQILFAPGGMYLQTGKRNFKKVPGTEEYAASGAYTDADGDGSPELALFVWSCISYSELGGSKSSSKQRLDFCKTHQGQTVAIYKFVNGRVKKISAMPKNAPIERSKVTNTIPYAIGSLGDCDGDSLVDHVLLRDGSYEVVASRNRGGMLKTSPNARTTSLGECSARFMLTGDYDGDGKTDIFVGCELSGSSMLFLQNGQCKFSRYNSIGSLGDRKCTYIDQLYCNQNQNNNLQIQRLCSEVLAGRKNSFGSNGPQGCSATNEDAEIVDFDFDGILDMITTVRRGVVKWHKGTGIGGRSNTLTVKLKGARSGVVAGATIIIKVPGQSTQLREIISAEYDTQLFGFGKDKPSEVTVRWRSGKTTTVQGSRLLDAVRVEGSDPFDMSKVLTVDENSAASGGGDDRPTTPETQTPDTTNVGPTPTPTTKPPLTGGEGGRCGGFMTKTTCLTPCIWTPRARAAGMQACGDTWNCAPYNVNENDCMNTPPKGTCTWQDGKCRLAASSSSATSRGGVLPLACIGERC